MTISRVVRRRVAFWVSGAAALLLLGAAAVPPSPPPSSDLETDEEVVFFQTTARYLEATPERAARWSVPIHAWVYEPEHDSLWRGVLLAGLRRQLGLEAGAEDSELFRSRARSFLADNERGKVLRVALAGAFRAMPASGAEGHVWGTMEIPAAGVGPEDLRALTRTPDGRLFEGRVHPAPPEGVTVVSDIDDTVKISQVDDHRELLRNTFLREYRAVDGLAERYTAWAEAGARFEYLSSSPWQLYEPLVEFLDGAGYPAGSLHLKSFRIKDESFLALFQAPEATKLPALETFLELHPGHRFVLIGDSGERDPEIYGEVARRHPGRVQTILVRELETSPMTEARRQAAFAELDPKTVIVFREARELPRRPW